MKQLVTLLFVIVSFAGYSQYKNVNQKLYFTNGIKIGDTLRTDSAGIYGSGQFLKIQDTTANPWVVIRGSETPQTDSSFFNRVVQSGQSSGVVSLKDAVDTLSVSTATINSIAGCVGAAGVGNATGGLTGIAISTSCQIDTIQYSDTTVSGLQPKVNQIGGARSGSMLTLVGGFRSASNDSSVVFIDAPPFYLNGNDTLKYRETLTLFIKDQTTFIEVSRSDN